MIYIVRFQLMIFKEFELKLSKIKIGDKVYRSKSYDWQTHVSDLDIVHEWELIDLVDYFKDIPDFIIIAVFYCAELNRYWTQTVVNKFYKCNDYKQNCYEQLSLF